MIIEQFTQANKHNVIIRHPIFIDVNLLIKQCKDEFLRLRYIVVMHIKRTCNNVCKFLNCTVFLASFPLCNS